MKHSIRIAAIRALALTATALPALAAAEHGGAYLGAAAARTQVDASVGGVTIDVDSDGFQILGGYRFGEYFGAEVGYVDLGDFAENTAGGRAPVTLGGAADGWTLGATMRWPLAGPFALTGRAGVYLWDATTRIGDLFDRSNGEDVYYGVGASVDLGDSVAVYGQWERFELDDIDPDVYSLGITLSF